MGEIARVENHWRGDKVSFIGLTVFAKEAPEREKNCSKDWAGGCCGGTLIS